MKNIAIIGDGGWGTTLAILLHSKGFKVKLWGAFADYIEEMKKARENRKFLPGVKIPQEVHLSSNIEEVLDKSDAVILAVPSQFLRSIIGKIDRKLIAEAIIISAIKGVEEETLLRMSQVITEVWGKVKVGVLSGPTIAYEVARGVPTTAVVSANEQDITDALQDLFMTEKFRIYTARDLVGVELGGALKNIVAIAAGITDGLGFGTNAKAALLTRGLAEISRLGVAMGAQAATFSGLSGIGDLVTTCISKYGRNRWFGEQIGKGKKINEILKNMQMVAEGIPTTKCASQLAEKHKVEMPITRQVYQILYEDKNPAVAVEELMKRGKKAE